MTVGVALDGIGLLGSVFRNEFESILVLARSSAFEKEGGSSGVVTKLDIDEELDADEDGYADEETMLCCNC